MTRRDLLVVLPVSAAQSNVLGNAAHNNPRLEKLFTMFIAPCCWRENLLVHSSPKADELRASIRELVDAGKTDDFIRDRLLGLYSSRILSVPEGTLGRWLTVTPWLVTGAGMLAITTLIWRSAGRIKPVDNTPPIRTVPDADWEEV